MSHHLSQESSQQPERGRHGGGGGGIMDLRNLCQRIDVDSLKAKLPAMPQLKLPKTLPKLRGARRIFRSSRDNVSGGGGNKAASHEGATVGAGGVSSGQLALPQQQQAAQFINRTPQRISTISSLMHEQTSTEQQQHHHHHLQPSGATYCSAGSLDDDYYAPYGGSMTARVSRPISPIKMPPTGNEQQQQQERGTLTQRLQRGYKSLSELRLKHLFAKQTVVRRDNIEVQRYVEQYEAERRVEQMAQARRDRDIADNYDIHISTLPITRQNTLKQQQDGEEEAEEDAVQQVRRMADHSGDESGLETPPPPPPPAVARKKKPGGIAATRFAKVRQPPLQMPVEEGAMDQQQQSQEKQPMRQAVRQKLKRLRKSMKRRQASQQQQQDSDDEEEEQEKQQQQQQQRGSTASNLRARLRRFASSEQLQQRWRKSFKGGDEEGTDTGTGKGGADIGGAGKGGAGMGGAGLRGAGLGGANKGGAGLGGVGLGGANKGGAALGGAGLGGAAAAGSGLGVAAQLERSLARLNEKLQQLKFFQRKSQQPQGNKPNTVGREPIEIDDEELPATYHHSDSDSEHGSNDSDDSGQDICAEDAFGQLDIADAPRSASPMLVKHQTLATLAQLQAHASTAWSSESLEEDIALDGQQQQQRDEMACTAADYPRVLIHQQHSDAYESTLIIAVTTTPPTPSPPHSQQHQQQQQPWLPNEQIIAGFKEQQQRDCWPAPMLYKPKSIDIFESGDGGAASAFADFDEALRNAPVLRISAGSSCDSNTEDADDNSSRVTRIRVQTPRIGNSRESLMEQQTLEQEEEQEEAEEALEELEEGQEQPEEQLEMERAEEESERPPSMSPPPPPLPQRRPPPPTSAAPIYDAVPPPLPISKPPTTLPTATAPPPLTAATTTTTVATAASTTSPVAAAPPTSASPVAAAPSLQRQPLRSASMTRPAKPLVKTSSLRLTYNEQMHPNDVGKVNKLISRFGGRSRLGARRLHSEELTICSDGDDESEELPEEPATPTPSNVKRSNSSNNNNINNNIIPDIVTTAASNNNNNNNETMQLDRQNSNCSRSEYGSPLAYPQLNATPTPTATTTTTATSARAGRPRAPQPQPQLQLQSQSQLQLQRRSRRSMTRDDDNFYSFDSDEENSYYSISPSSSSRYVVEI